MTHARKILIALLAAVLAALVFLLARCALVVAERQPRPVETPVLSEPEGLKPSIRQVERDGEVSRSRFRYRTQVMIVTAYTAGKESTGKEPGDPGYGFTTSKEPVHTGCIAADQSIPFGTRIYIPGYGWGVVKDRGGDIKGDRLDVFIPGLKEALKWGRQTLPCVFEYPFEHPDVGKDGEPI